MLKKIISIVMAMFVLLSCSCTALAWTELSDANDPNIVRIGVISDTHQKFSGLQTATNAYYALDSSLDGLMFTGDVIYMTDSVDISLYDSLLTTTIGPEEKTVASLLDEDFIAFAMGNHEVPLHADAATTATCTEGFTEKTGQAPNSVKTFGGYRVISISPNDYNGNFTDATADYLKEQVDAALAETTGPVFINTHFGFHQSVVGTGTWGFSCLKVSDEKLSILEEIKSNPRIIVVSGHTHESTYDPRAIYQQAGGFTAVENSMISGGNDPYSEGLLIEINKTTNNVKIRRLDFNTGKEIGEPWVINTDGTNQLYTAAAREAQALAPAFPAEAIVTVDANETSAVISIPAATKFAESETDYARYYDVTYTNYATGVAQNKTFDSDFYTTQKDTLQFQIDGLTAGTEYIVSVVARSPYKKVSEAITSEKFKTDDVEFENITLTNVITKGVGEATNSTAASKYGSFHAFAGSNYITFSYDVETTGFYRISTKIGAGGANPPAAKLYVDDVPKSERQIFVGAWGGGKQTREDMIWLDCYLKAGTHTIMLQRTSSGGPDSYILESMSVGMIPADKVDPVKYGYSVQQTVKEALDYNPNYWKDEYALTEDTEIDETKTYYTLSGTTYTAVATPVADDIATYYEKIRSAGSTNNQNHGTYFVVLKDNSYNTTFKLTPEYSGVYDLSVDTGLYSTSTYTCDSKVTITETRTLKYNKKVDNVNTTVTADAVHTVGTFEKTGMTGASSQKSYGVVPLEAGKEYTIVYDNTSASSSNYLLLSSVTLTCINFDPSAHNLVTKTYAGEATASAVAQTNKYGTGADSSNHGWNTQNQYMQFTVFVPADAKYDVYLYGGSGGNHEVHYTIQGQSYVSRFENTTIYAADGVTVSKKGFDNNKVERLLTAGVNLRKGYYTVYYDTVGSTDGLNTRAFVLKTSGAYSSDNTVLEYVDYDKKSTQSNNYTTQGWMTAPTSHYIQWTDRYFTAGTYKVYLNYGTYNNTDVSAILDVDGRCVATTPVETNGKYGTHGDSTANNGTPIDLNGAFKGYVATIRLDEGLHTIKLRTTKYYLIVDKVKFVPITEPMAELFNAETVNLDQKVTEIQDGAMTLRANLPKTDLGKTMNVIFAIYETANVEGALPELYLCKIQEVKVDENYRAILTIPNISKAEGKTYTYKVFYWDNLNNVKPLY